MNFKEFYHKTETRLTDAILSLWATGDKKMQEYFKHLISEKTIIAETVFQATFPWEQAECRFDNLTDIFSQEFINALDSIKNTEFRFPKERYPYRHQLASWKKLLKEKESIVVTTGTGSGKTECFMLPVLQDIYTYHRNQEGINAIFLYPLNALIASQQKRMHAWCSALEGISYALLMGATPETANPQDRINAEPQLISREQIRRSPPQILFTNPTMLEYLLVRNADVPIIEKSQGKLRWIILDEAHTLTGSKAAEMALLIRRVISTFGVKEEDVRFAITSATVGDGNKETLKRFMSNLCGISADRIEVIQGKRINNDIPDYLIPDISENISASKIIKLRNELLTVPGMTQTEIGQRLGISVKEKYAQLEAIDQIADLTIKVNDNQEENLLPIRGHFFTRGISGVYVCINRQCEKHKDIKPHGVLGPMSTISEKTCDCCGFPMLELIACRSCGRMMLEGELKNGRVTQKASKGFEVFQTEEEEDIENKAIRSLDFESVRFILNDSNQRLANRDLPSCSIDIEGKLDMDLGEDFLFINDEKCPFCGSRNEIPIHFRISSAFTNRILSDIILDQTNPTREKKPDTIYEGKKYISFTDSRQGTAKIAAQINSDTESGWTRHMIYHYLLNKFHKNKIEASVEELHQARTQLQQQLEAAPPFLKRGYQRQLDDINRQLSNSNGHNLSSSRSTWRELMEAMRDRQDFKTLFLKVAQGDDFVMRREAYAKSLLYDQFARRLPRERSLENLGLVNLVYPELENVVIPQEAEKLGINAQEWKDLLKIAADYILRYNFHFAFDDEIRIFSTRNYFPSLIFSSDSDTDGAKWPSYNPKSITQTRLVLLICAGLGWHKKQDIDKENEDLLNQLLEKIWRTLRERVLIEDNYGYKLDLLNKTYFELAGKETLCPVMHRLIDNTFRGYTPWIKGSLTCENIGNFHIHQPIDIQYPTYPYPYHLTDNNVRVERVIAEQWIEENSKEAKQKGLWNDFHKKVYDFEKLYLAGEHSAQQKKQRLKRLEEEFEQGKLNILSCSTTMEMGVDIGGISAVVMSNVPPMPANYLQRTGRAGRRKENKSLALTFCAPNPIGLRTMKEPRWALEHKIAPPILKFDSNAIVERHINSLFFGFFIRSNRKKKGLNVKENIEIFFFGTIPTFGEEFLKWLNNLDVNQYKDSIFYLTKDTIFEKAVHQEIKNRVYRNFLKVKNDVQRQIDNFDDKLREIDEEWGNNSTVYKAVDLRKKSFLKKHILNYLAENNFLPNAGLPTGIVEFDNKSIKDIKYNYNKDQFIENPTYPITRALSEFAPGNSILIDGLNYKSAGIILKNDWGRTGEMNTVHGCSNCGYQFVESISFKSCPHCKTNGSLRGINLNGTRAMQLIEPVGFAVDLFSEPNRVISEKAKPQYLEPLLLNLTPWDNKPGTIVELRKSNEKDGSKILFYNIGDGNGYSICLDCGRVDTRHENLEDHNRLRGGKNKDGENACTARNVKDNVILGARFKTDFTEIRLLGQDGLLINNRDLIYSLGVIFTKSLSEYLAVEESELAFGIKQYRDYQTIFIYDTARGGAGYASQFGLHVNEILEKSLNILSKCDCQKACTKCLIDRESQWHMENLDRNIAVEWLTFARTNQQPKELFNSEYRDKTSSVLSNISSELLSLQYHYGIKRIDIHVNNRISDWDIENFEWLDNLKRERVDINLVVEGELNCQNFHEKLSLHKLSVLEVNLKSGVRQKVLNYNVHYVVYLNNGNAIGFISQSDFLSLTPDIFDRPGLRFYKIESFTSFALNELSLPQLNSNVREVKIKSLPYHYCSSKNLADRILEELEDRSDFIEKIKNKRFIVDYYDKYNQSEFSKRLLLHFMKNLSEITGMTIDKFKIHLSERDFKEYRIPYLLGNNYTSLEKYQTNLDAFFGKFSQDYNFDTKIVREDRMPHYRYFEFKSDDLSFTIRIDGGIAHGLRPEQQIPISDVAQKDPDIKIEKYVLHDLIYTFTE
ncbi:Helicase conserved C-terminal domain-containing protein [Porphyromonadaceae bacterium KH3CP3RA]|nr:Helicase conserved C-terminal domain-containing protein [Porphyromonadaceae bacterium KH3CP3RA]